MSTVVRLAPIKEQTQEWAGEYLERFAGDAQKQGVAFQKVTVEGRPNAAILQFAEANQVDLIVICTRGRSGFSRCLMGSVADPVVRGAAVPVLLVRAAKVKTEAWWEPPSERTCARAACWHPSAGRRTLLPQSPA